MAEASKRRLAESGRLDGEIVTPILDAEEFYRAEEYHQDYYNKMPEDYHSYRSGSGRDQYIEETWSDDKRVEGLVTKQERYGSFDRDEQIEQLDEMQYEVVLEDGTEPAFNNRYWDNKRSGIYVDLLSGEPLFSSTDKFVSGTGWPSFTRPIEPDNIIYALDTRLGTERIETRSRFGDAHLGHVFEDGPEPLGIRYCMNSAALEFVPLEEMEERGYAQFLVLFD
jgi:peptide methionine sulfoxide reductase msrA/msrB